MRLAALPAHVAGARYDFAMVGAGAAGLCLALELVQRFPEARIALIDPGFADLDNRTFAFWCEGEPPFAALVARSWDRLGLVTRGDALIAPLERYRYHVIAGTTFRDHALSVLAASGRVWWARGRAEEIEDGEECVHVRVDHTELAASWAFDSRLDERRPPVDDPRAPLLVQRFLGWELETSEERFDPGVATLFDFRVPSEGDQRFVYVLPFTSRRALVELVTLGRCEADELLAAYVRDVLGVEAMRIVRREAGDSPLIAARFVRREGWRILRIGNAGGRLKPSSGYAFTRIALDTRAIARSLETSGHPFDLPEDHLGFRALDAIFLGVTAHAPERMSEVFLSMFRTSGGDRVLRFLDERASLADVITLGIGLPVAPFAVEVGRMIGAGLARLGEPPGYEG